MNPPTEDEDMQKYAEKDGASYGLAVDDQIELGDHNRVFWDALKKADRKFGEGKQALWEAGAAAKEMRALVPHGQWEDYCRDVLTHDPAWIWRLIRFSESCSYIEAGDVSNITAYLAAPQDLDGPGIENIEVTDADQPRPGETYKTSVQIDTHAREDEAPAPPMNEEPPPAAQEDLPRYAA